MTSGKSPSPTRRIPDEAVAISAREFEVLVAVTAGARTFGEIAAATGIGKSLLNVPLRRLAASGLISFAPKTRGSIRPAVSFRPLYQPGNTPRDAIDLKRPGRLPSDPTPTRKPR